ncbi:hypothetical protein [Maritimibacter sp. HL-12]|uniref:hypothetical protein n=1 Tax=Maritimibacter sp. HL-12 TaxID=1162418 RepID=UPI000A0EF63F|nr:hypothetical protein [Maritimibacter sp. HL-12]SMH35996.1 hypothetical protein SAMN05661107_0674 [Maritimibacter sp. HL-12]
MSMYVSISESEIAEAIVRGDIGLADLLEALRIEVGDNYEFAEFVATDISRHLDEIHIRPDGIDGFYESIQNAAEKLSLDAAAALLDANSEETEV